MTYFYNAEKYKRIISLKNIYSPYLLINYVFIYIFDNVYSTFIF